MGCTYSQWVALQNSSGSNREEPIIFNRREDISPKVPQPNAKKQVNRNSQQRAWRPESAAPRTEPLRQPGPPGVDCAPKTARSRPVVPREPGLLEARSPRCHWSCSRSPSPRSCQSRWCSPTLRCWNALRPRLPAAPAERCGASESQRPTRGGFLPSRLPSFFAHFSATRKKGPQRLPSSTKWPWQPVERKQGPWWLKTQWKSLATAH